MKAEVLPDYNSSYTNTSNIENGHIHQPELDQQLKNILSLIQVGLIDPKENPIIIGTAKDDDYEKSTKLSFCDKIKIVGILIFLIIVTVVVTLCIIYMFVPFFSKRSKNTDFKGTNGLKATRITFAEDSCNSIYESQNDFNSFFGIVETFSKITNETNHCLATLISPNKILTSLSCFYVLQNFSKLNINEKRKIFDTQFRTSLRAQVFFDIKENYRFETTMNSHNVTKINLINSVSNQEMIEIEFDTINITYKFVCSKNSTDVGINLINLMYVLGQKIDNNFIISKSVCSANLDCSSMASSDSKVLPGSSFFTNIGTDYFQLTGLEDIYPKKIDFYEYDCNESDKGEIVLSVDENLNISKDQVEISEKESVLDKNFVLNEFLIRTPSNSHRLFLKIIVNIESTKLNKAKTIWVLNVINLNSDHNGDYNIFGSEYAYCIKYRKLSFIITCNNN
ncbi:unnamed protein product [Brachionus calyciflorus]|uniref:Uncharacterized protein n=1 Tax=Brachionus calyciflorus TaxID=104777 RepID=A0A813LVY7_9BILA|nr:unnamed protein product [Brachionus calyciflorus]